MEENLFFPNQSINIMYPNVENLIVVPIIKRKEIIMRIQVWLISRTNIGYKENGQKKAFLAKPSTNIVYPNEMNMLVLPTNHKSKDCYEHPSFSRFADEL